MASAQPPYTVSPVPLFSDNYAWRVDTPRGETVFVDAADAGPCLSSISEGAAIVGVLTTHYHADHAGDNPAIAAAVPGVAVVGGAAEGGRVPAMTRGVGGGDVVELAGLRFEVIATPCHTRGHVAYYLPPCTGAPDGALFTGDTLFAGGCGRFFEGGAAEMLDSLGRLGALPPETRVFCGHEYTVANLQFCAAVEPGNATTAARLASAAAERAAGRPTVPSTLAVELATNVFLRTGVPEVVRFTHGADAAAASPVEVMARLREAKNAFKPPPLP